jgi:hypothetical protein
MHSEFQHFRRRNNVDWVQPFKLNTYDPTTNTREDFNLTGCELKMLLVGPTSGHPSLLLSTLNGLLVLSTAVGIGEFFIDVPATEMWTLAEGTYLGDLLILTPAGEWLLAFVCEVEIEAGETAPTP